MGDAGSTVLGATVAVALLNTSDLVHTMILGKVYLRSLKNSYQQ
jgi:UDP-N-acetylmuramyl pentapeptide phosphotransferase/UDP-N-acetylglucosamine-1-phosphate transferase